MTILPAGDGDVWPNNGAKYYDRAQPAPFKSQLYVHYTNHNFFNRQWLADDGHGPPVMSRHDHERILLVYGCAFFRSTLLGHGDTVRFLSGHMIPSGVVAENVHLSFEQREVLTVDNHEDRNGIGRNSLNRPTSQAPPNIADEYPFGQVSGTFNSSKSFFGDSIGMVIKSYGRFRSQLREPTDLTEREIWIRVAEVYNGTSIPTNATGFELGLEDSRGVIVWTDSDSVGGLSRPYHRRNDDLLDLGRDATKTMLKTLRFRSECFAATNPEFDIRRIVAILIRTNRDDQRALAFDDLQIV